MFSQLPLKYNSATLQLHYNSSLHLNLKDFFLLYVFVLVNPLTALDEYIRPKAIAACVDYSASYSQNFQKPTPCFR